MNLNSQYAFYPAQPPNPTAEDRHGLLKHALQEKGWPEDISAILTRMAPPPPVTDFAEAGAFHGYRVGIIGGGLAGLSAAYELRKVGFDVTLYEALRDRVGGRVYTCYFGSDPRLYGEFGAMRIPVSHETVWHYIQEFGLSTYPFIQANPNALVYLSDTRVRGGTDSAAIKENIYPHYDMHPWERRLSWQELLYLGTDSHLLGATTAQRAEILEVSDQYSPRARQWQSSTVLTMLEASGLSQGAISLVSNFVPLLKSNLYNSFIDYIQESYPADLSYLYTIAGGLSLLPAAFYRSFFSDTPARGLRGAPLGQVTYRADCQVNAIGLSDTGNQIVLSYAPIAGGSSTWEAFDFAVCAIPFSTLRTIALQPTFTERKMRAIREVNYTATQKTLFLCQQRFWEAQGIVGGGSFTDLPIASVWYPSDHPRQQGAVEAPGVITGAFNFGMDTTRLLNLLPDGGHSEMLRELAAVHGLGVDTLYSLVQDIRTVDWTQEPTFRGGLCFFTPEQKCLFADTMAAPEYGGRLFFAGEHISAVHRWMQGALQSGMQAATNLTKSANLLTKR